MDTSSGFYGIIILMDSPLGNRLFDVHLAFASAWFKKCTRINPVAVTLPEMNGRNKDENECEQQTRGVVCRIRSGNR